MEVAMEDVTKTRREVSRVTQLDLMDGDSA